MGKADKPEVGSGHSGPKDGAHIFSAVLGLEIHVQLATKSKMFCRCDNDSENAAPNAHTCEVCLGMPGTLPVPNRTAVEWAIKTALALGCAIPDESKFDRKQYFYPDLPKGYQISQYDQPLGGPGAFEFDRPQADGQLEPFTVRITRLHLEEDAGKLTHPAGKKYSLVDLNRAGTPLMEIVTDPIVVEDPAEVPLIAKTFLQELRLVMRYLGVSSADMEKGHLRCDANISLHQKGAAEWGAKVEVKNMNSFRFVERALKAEITRQATALAAGETIAQETRGYDEATGRTISQRSKEEAMDYRYFPEPDIPPLLTSELSIDRLKEEIPELPVALRRRWERVKPGINPEVAYLASTNQSLSKVLHELIEMQLSGEELSKVWLNTALDVESADFATLVLEMGRLASEGKITVSQVKALSEKSARAKKDPKEILEEDPTFQHIELSDLQPIIDQAIADNPRAVADYRKGNANAKQVLMGAVMKATKGSANPTAVLPMIEKSLEQ